MQPISFPTILKRQDRYVVDTNTPKALSQRLCQRVLFRPVLFIILSDHHKQSPCATQKLLEQDNSVNENVLSVIFFQFLRGKTTFFKRDVWHFNDYTYNIFARHHFLKFPHIIPFWHCRGVKPKIICISFCNTFMYIGFYKDNNPEIISIVLVWKCLCRQICFIWKTLWAE